MSLGAYYRQFYWAVTAFDGRQPVAAAVPLHRRVGGLGPSRHGSPFGALPPCTATTKRDLTAMGKFLFMGLIGLILAGLVNMILPSGTMSFIISAVRRADLLGPDRLRHPEDQGAVCRVLRHRGHGEDAVFGALSLYLDFVNLFQFLMSFLGQERD